MSDQPVHLSASGPPETIIPQIATELRTRLDTALVTPIEGRRRAVGDVVADHPTFLEGWATIGDLSEPGIDAYMAYRVGYHRGLDTLRANSWRGSGYVRWARESNRGFLRCLAGLAKQSRRIGEISEAVRCEQFLLQLDPSGDASK
jgi:Protein of unknown function (DUF3151)